MVPPRFLRPELRELLPRILRPADRFCYAEVYYAGGTVTRDVTGRVLADDLPPRLRGGHAADHAAVVRWVAAEARQGDTVLLMGARDLICPAWRRRYTRPSPIRQGPERLGPASARAGRPGAQRSRHGAALADEAQRPRGAVEGIPGRGRGRSSGKYFR